MTNPGIGIRPYETADAALFCEAARESVDEIFPWMPWCHHGYSLEEAEAWVTSRRHPFDEGIEREFAIVDRSGRLLGAAASTISIPAIAFANMGYWVRTSASGRGRGDSRRSGSGRVGLQGN
jgi:RimJ/RimL family protein N-acetyltransferase